MTPCGFGNASFNDRLLYRTLRDRFMQVVPVLFSGYPLGIMACRWKDPLQPPFLARIRVLLLQRTRSRHPSRAL